MMGFVLIEREKGVLAFNIQNLLHACVTTSEKREGEYVASILFYMDKWDTAVAVTLPQTFPSREEAEKKARDVLLELLVSGGAEVKVIRLA